MALVALVQIPVKNIVVWENLIIHFLRDGYSSFLHLYWDVSMACISMWRWLYTLPELLWSFLLLNIVDLYSQFCTISLDTLPPVAVLFYSFQFYTLHACITYYILAFASTHNCRCAFQMEATEEQPLLNDIIFVPTVTFFRTKRVSTKGNNYVIKNFEISLFRYYLLPCFPMLSIVFLVNIIIYLKNKIKSLNITFILLMWR